MVLPEMHDLDPASPDWAALLRAVGERHGEALVKAAARLERMFLLGSPWAPGLAFVGALARSAWPSSGDNAPRIGFAGGGESIEDAFVSCVGEAAERLSQFEREGDVRSRSIAEAGPDLGAPLADLVEGQCRTGRIAPSEAADWLPARDLATGGPRLVPADWVLRRTADGVLRDSQAALSTGAAAGESLAAATLRAVLELVERDAAALWWQGGLRARPLSLESGGLAEAVRLTLALRRGATGRVSWALDITSDLGIPTVAAISCDGDGRGFVCGLASRLTRRAAARSAVLELCQLEIGLLLARAKREQGGDAALTEIDRRHLQRADAIDAEACELIHPIGVPHSGRGEQACAALADADTAVQLHHLIRSITGAGIAIALVDLTRADTGIPVVKAIAPQLQQLPSSLRTRRLADALDRTGGATRWTHDIPLT